MAAPAEMAAMLAPAASWRGTQRAATVAARPVIPERAALAATLLADRAATAATAATVGRLMAASLLVAMAVLEAAVAAVRSGDLAASEEMAAMVATAASWRGTRRAEAMAARPVIPERAALVATLLADRAAMAATAATVGRLMAASRFVAMAGLEVCTAAAGSEP